MSLINYFFIGIVFTFILDLILYKLKNHHLMKGVIEKWGYKERIACALIWPIAITAFIYSLIKEAYKETKK